MAFLEKTALDLLEKYNGDLSNIAVIFPNKRAGLFFKKFIQGNIEKPVWAPEFYSFEEWVCSVSDYSVIDIVRLVFKLYGIYSKSVSLYKKGFDEFYHWGKMILSDFDDIDRYLIDAGMLFRNLREMKKIEDINIGTQSSLYKKYLGFWNELEIIYNRLREELISEKTAYPGMIYRSAAENLSVLDSGRWRGFVFAGFNALTASEKKIIEGLKEISHVDIYIDMDQYFTGDESQEAGRFYRETWKNMLDGNDIKWNGTDLSGEKNITITGTSSSAGQAKLLGVLLQGHLTLVEKTAVILADESLLFPVLNSLPGEIGKINITMGYPLKNTPAYSLVNLIFDLQETMEGSGSDLILGYNETMKFLEHPYISNILDSGLFIKTVREKNLTKIPAVMLPFPEFMEDTTGKKWPEAGPFLKSLSKMLESMISLKNRESQGLEAEFLFMLYTQVERLAGLVSEYEPGLGMKPARNLLNDIISGSIIPFIGRKPWKGFR